MDGELREMIEGWSRAISEGLHSQAVEEMEALLERTSPAFTEYDAARMEFESTLAMIGVHVVLVDLPPDKEKQTWRGRTRFSATQMRRLSEVIQEWDAQLDHICEPTPRCEEPRRCGLGEAGRVRQTITLRRSWASDAEYVSPRVQPGSSPESIMAAWAEQVKEEFVEGAETHPAVRDASVEVSPVSIPQNIGLFSEVKFSVLLDFAHEGLSGSFNNDYDIIQRIFFIDGNGGGFYPVPQEPCCEEPVP